MYTSSSFSKTACALAALCALGGGVAFSAQSASSSAADRAFVQQAAKAGTEEVTEGKVESTSSDPNAAKFAKLMVRDHSKANAQLKIIAKNNGLTSALQQGVAAAKPAKTLPPQTYLRKEVPDHQKAIALFRQESQTGKNPSLRDFAKSALPTLQMHLELAKRYSNTGSGSSGK